MKTIALTMLAAVVAASSVLAAPAATNAAPKKAEAAAPAVTNATPAKAEATAPADKKAEKAAPKNVEAAAPAADKAEAKKVEAPAPAAGKAEAKKVEAPAPAAKKAEAPAPAAKKAEAPAPVAKKTEKTAPAAKKSDSKNWYGGSSSWNKPLSFEEDDVYERWIKGRLSVGVVYSSFTLENKKRPANREEDYLGNINELTDHHNKRYAPILEYRPIDYLSFGISYMHVEAGTLNFNNGEGDGTASLSGPTFTAELALPLIKGIIVPHAGIGYASLKGDFKEDTWWGLSYSSPEAWAAYGSPTEGSRTDHYRYIEVDDASETYFTAGISIIPHPHVKLDVSYHKIELDPSCVFGYDYSPRGRGKQPRNHGDFDMGGEFWLFSVSYIF